MKEKKIEMDGLQLEFQMDQNEWQTQIRKADTRVKDIRQFGILNETADRFVPVRVTETGDHYSFHFIVQEDWKTWAQVKKRTRAEKLRLLGNISAYFHGLPARITYFLHPDNLLFNENLMPLSVYRGIRDLMPPMEMDEEHLLKQYKCLAIALFAKELTFDQLYNGSLANATETEFERKVNEMNSIGELAAFLKESYREEQDKSDKMMQLVPASRFKLFKWLAFSMIALAVLLAVPLGYFLIVKQPFEQHLLEAHRNNLASDYDGVITSLQKANPEKLPDPAKYILANAYVRTADLKPAEREVILKNISLKSDKDYLLYWIYSGRGDFEKSIDLAKLLDDPRLIIYGLINKIEQDKNNPELKGEERDERVRKAEDELRRYREEYGLEEDSEAAEGQQAESADQNSVKEQQQEEKKQQEQKKSEEKKKAEEKKK
ncbi:type VII secretion protein EssB [Aciduricibacillus chroicocephali]|uniref:Type VII secretion protein EssB n=1 Tax=Aciduricibacillus chroicocephali TaxID=3054939 RepID=A0ABY9KTZ6_9BACI|nr:type VII secretion protein EssB [Bacillaceae bacterium 44XB]